MEGTDNNTIFSNQTIIVLARRRHKEFMVVIAGVVVAVVEASTLAVVDHLVEVTARLEEEVSCNNREADFTEGGVFIEEEVEAEVAGGAINLRAGSKIKDCQIDAIENDAHIIILSYGCICAPPSFEIFIFGHDC